MTVSKSITGWAFSLPALLLYLPFVILPFVGTIYMSLFDWTGFQRPIFTGLMNFRIVFDSPEWRQSLVNTSIYLVATLGLEVCVGLVLALWLAGNIPGSRLYQGLFFAPVILSMTVVGLLWKFVLNPYFGLLNGILETLGLESWCLAWLGDTRTALLSVCIVSGWKYAGFYMVIFLAALTGIPKEIMEASLLDGTSGVGRAYHVTLPLLGKTWWLCVLLCATGAFQTFDLIYVLTNGGPHHSTEVVISWMIKVAFDRLNLGQGCAIAVLSTAMVLMLAVPYRWLASRKENAS